MTLPRLGHCIYVVLICSILVMQHPSHSLAQSAVPARYKPCQFKTSDGEDIYLNRLIMMLPYSEQYLITIATDPMRFGC